MRISNFNFLVKQGARNIWKNRIMSFASFCIMTVSLLLFGFSILFSMIVNSMIGDIEDKNEVIVFLEDDTSEEYIEEMEQKLKDIENISKVTFYSKEEAFEDLKASMDNAEEIFSYLGDESPLPDAFKIKISNIDYMSSTLMIINGFDHIEKVKAPYDFVNVLTGIQSIVTIVTIVLLVALLIVSFVIVTNTNHASVDFRKKEIHIMRYVGATSAFIKVPFFIEGALIGFFSGAAALFVTWVGYQKLIDVLSEETTLISALGVSGFISTDTFIKQAVILYLVAGTLFSSISTVISTQRYVKV